MNNTQHLSRMARFQEAGLYLVTSQELSAGRTTLDVLDAALDAGVKLVQLREKNLPVSDLMRLAEVVRARTSDYGALLIINDRLDVALACGADGAHLGQQDLPIAHARRIAPDLVLGASSHNLEEALAAEQAGASYVNIGPIFPTRTKEWTEAFLGLAGLRAIAPRLRIPFTVMGGIKLEHVAELTEAGARTIALVTAVTAAPEPGRAARDLLDAIMTGRASSRRDNH